MAHHIEPVNCPHCGHEVDTAEYAGGTVADDGTPPADGDLNLCTDCNQISVFEGKGLRLVKQSDYPLDPNIIDVMNSRHKVQ